MHFNCPRIYLQSVGSANQFARAPGPVRALLRSAVDHAARSYPRGRDEGYAEEMLTGPTPGCGAPAKEVGAAVPIRAGAGTGMHERMMTI